MSKYTTEVRFICESYAGWEESGEYGTVREAVTAAAPKIFTDFPIFDESYRLALEIKILEHFYFREIGVETVGLWKQYLSNKMNEIMPFYNKMYQSELLSFNPFYDTDYTVKQDENKTGREEATHTTGTESDRTDTESTVSGMSETEKESKTGSWNETDGTSVTAGGNTSGKETGTGTTSGTITENNKQYYSDTPQGGITGLETLNYLTNATINDNTRTESGSTGNTVNSEGSYNDTSKTDVTKTGSDSNTGERGKERSENGTKNGTSKTTGSEHGEDEKNITDTRDYLEHVAGKRGTSSYAALLSEYRDTFLNIDMNIIGELEPLFMQIW